MSLESARDCINTLGCTAPAQFQSEHATIITKIRGALKLQGTLATFCNALFKIFNELAVFYFLFSGFMQIGIDLLDLRWIDRRTSQTKSENVSFAAGRTFISDNNLVTAQLTDVPNKTN